MRDSLLRAATLLASLVLSGCPFDDDEDGVAAPRAVPDDASVEAAQASDPPGEAITPLPDSSFVYLHREDTITTHLRAFDTKTGTSSLITAFDNRTSGTNVKSIALSRDRKWVAFAAFFRVSDEEQQTQTTMPTPPVWIVSVDGKTFKRVAPPFAPPPGKACRSDLDCRLEGLACNFFKYCDLPDHSRDLYVHSWTAASPLVLEYRESWRGGSMFTGGVNVATVALPESLPLVANAARGGCMTAVGGDLRDGKILVARRGTISGAECKKGELVEFDPSHPDVPAQGLFVDSGTSELEIQTRPPRWLRDGSGFTLVANESSTNTLLVGDVAKKTVRRLAILPAGSVENMTVSPSSRHLVVSIRAPGWTDPIDLYLVTVGDGTVTRLTTDARSSWPSG
jgi:hypothetical protein